MFCRLISTYAELCSKKSFFTSPDLSSFSDFPPTIMRSSLRTLGVGNNAWSRARRCLSRWIFLKQITIRVIKMTIRGRRIANMAIMKATFRNDIKWWPCLWELWSPKSGVKIHQMVCVLLGWHLLLLYGESSLHRHVPNWLSNWVQIEFGSKAWHCSSYWQDPLIAFAGTQIISSKGSITSTYCKPVLGSTPHWQPGTKLDLAHIMLSLHCSFLSQYSLMRRPQY